MDMVIERFRDVAVVRLGGDQLDAAHAREFKEYINGLIQTHAKIIFDLSAVRFIDSYGMGAMLAVLMRLNARGGDLKLCGVNPTVRMLFERAYLHRLFEIFKDTEEAVRSNRWKCDWKSIDIALTPDGSIRRRAMAFGGEKNAA